VQVNVCIDGLFLSRELLLEVFLPLFVSGPDRILFNLFLFVSDRDEVVVVGQFVPLDLGGGRTKKLFTYFCFFIN
jgi:hypothetical protein